MAIALALASACLFAFGNATQHRAASDFKGKGVSASSLLIRLIRTPLWLLGSAVSLIAYSLHAVALVFGPIAVVQPLMIVGVVLAVPIRAAIDRRPPSRGETVAVVVTSAGLALFVITTSSALPAASKAGFSTTAGITGAVGVGVATLVFFAARLLPRHSHLVTMGYGATAGILFGTCGGLLKATMDSLHEQGMLATGASWGPWVLIAVSLLGTTINQKAYQMGPIVYSMPILNMGSIMVAISFGVVALGEVPTSSIGAGAVQLGALALIAIGLLRTAQLETAVATIQNQDVGATHDGRRQVKAKAKRMWPTTAVRGAATHLLGATIALSLGYIAANVDSARYDTLFTIACVAAMTSGGMLVVGWRLRAALARAAPTTSGALTIDPVTDRRRHRP